MPGSEKLLKEMEFHGTLGLTDAERQNIYNLARRQQAGETRGALQDTMAVMGGRGFHAGESGIADTVLGQIRGEGAERMGRLSSELAADEAQRRAEQQATEKQLQISALTGAGQIEASKAQASAASAAARMNAQVARERLAWEQERYKEYEFPFQQQQSAWDNLFNMYGMQYGAQEQGWDRYADMLG
jgi:hypothetical protein